MGAGASTEKSAQERKSYGNLAGAVVSAKALRAALESVGDDDVSLEIVVFEEAILSWYEGRVRVSPLARTTTRWRA